MKCQQCQKEFDPHENAIIGASDGDSVEVRTACPHCDHGHYTFTPNHWEAEERAEKFIEHEQAAGRMARPKNIKSRRSVS